MKKILICGYYGYSNWGDEAILAGLLEVLTCASSSIDCTVLTSQLSITRKQHGVKAAYFKPIYGSNIWAKFMRFRHRDLPILSNEYFILGGGDLLRDSVLGDVAGSWLGVLARAIKFKRKSILLGISVGEIWKPETVKKIPRLLNMTRMIGVRDCSSLSKLKKLGVDPSKLILTPDLALANISDLHGPDKTKPRELVGSCFKIAISLRDIAVRGQESESINLDSSMEKLATTLDAIRQSNDIEITFIPFQGNRDLIVIDEFVSKTSFSGKFTILKDPISIDELVKQISQFNLVIGMRLHSIILAAGLGIPVVALAYDVKVTNFMANLNQDNFNIKLSDFSSDELISRINYILENYDSVSEGLKESLAEYMSKWELAMPKLADSLDTH